MDCSESTQKSIEAFKKAKDLFDFSKRSVSAAKEMSKGVGEELFYLSDELLGVAVSKDVERREAVAETLELHYIWPISEGMAWAQRWTKIDDFAPAELKFYLVNADKKEIIAGPFDEKGLDFSGGVALVQNTDSFWLVDLSGNQVGKKYDKNDYFFREESDLFDQPILLCNKSKGRETFFLARDGQEILAGKNPIFSSFAGGVNWFENKKERKISLIDNTGETLFEISDEYTPGQFQSEYALIFKKNDEGLFNVFRTDKAGQIVDLGVEIIDCQNVVLENGYYSAQYEPWKTVFFDNSGKVLKLKAHAISDFSCGLAVIEALADTDSPTYNGGVEFYFINREGKRVFEGKAFYDCESFSEGFAAVPDGRGGDWYFISTSGEPLRDCRGEIIIFQGASSFHYGVALIEQWNQFVYINRKGEIVDKNFHEAEDFVDGVARVTDLDDDEYFIDRTGKRVFSYEPEELFEDFGDGR